MRFRSILFKKETPLVTHTPECFADLNLMPVIEAITAGREDYNLHPFFFTLLDNVDEVAYRQEVSRDIEAAGLTKEFGAFAAFMQAMRQHLLGSDKTDYKYEKERLFLESVEKYIEAVHFISDCLASSKIRSEALLKLRDYLADYIKSAEFISLHNETQNLFNDLSTVRYGVIIQDLRVQVIPYNLQADYSEEVMATFQLFSRQSVKNYAFQLTPNAGMNHVEAAIISGVAQLYPEIFERLVNYPTKHRKFRDEVITRVDREIQFYLSYNVHIAKLNKSGLRFCYPAMSPSAKEVSVINSFDLALASKLVVEDTPVVCNDFYLRDTERILVVTGPNQGGKTTFARMFGQLHYLAALGLPVPGSDAHLFLCDQVFTHFEREEDTKNLRSKLEDDLIRIHDILEKATPRSVIVLNEILSSTTYQDAVFLSKKIMARLHELDVMVVWVTFIDELLTLSDKAVSMVSIVRPDNPAVRTFKIERRPADGLAYALSIAERYRVTYEILKQRLRS